MMDGGYEDRFYAFVAMAGDRERGDAAHKLGQSLVVDATDVPLFILGMELVVARRIAALRKALGATGVPLLEKAALTQFMNAIEGGNHKEAQRIGAALFLDATGALQPGQRDLALGIMHDALSLPPPKHCTRPPHHAAPEEGAAVQEICHHMAKARASLLVYLSAILVAVGAMAIKKTVAKRAGDPAPPPPAAPASPDPAPSHDPSHIASDPPQSFQNPP